MQEINLLQNRLKDTTVISEARNKILITILTVVLILELGLSAVFYIFNKNAQNNITTLKQENVRLQNDFNAKQNDLSLAKAFQAQLKNLTALVNNHLVWNNFFDELTKQTYNKAQFLILTADVTGKAHIEGKVNDYTNLGKLLLGFSTSNDFKNVKLLSSNPATGKVSGFSFALQLEANQELFKQK